MQQSVQSRQKMNTHALPRVLCASMALTVLSITTQAQAKNWDIYLLAGQSNAQGTGTNANALPTSLQGEQSDVRFFNGTGGSPGSNPAVDSAPLGFESGFLAPGTGAGNSPTAFGPEITLGRSLADANPDSNIAIVKYTIGATNLFNDWNPDDPGINLYDNLLTTLDNAIAALPPGDTFTVNGAVWYQGESDATNNQADSYQANLQNFLANLREDVGVPDLPVGVAQLGYATSGGAVNFATVQNAQAKTAALDDNTYLASTSDFNLSDQVHINSQGQTILGARLASAIQGDLNQLQVTNGSFEVPNLGERDIESGFVSGFEESGAGIIGFFNPDTDFYSNTDILDINGGSIGDQDGTSVLFLFANQGEELSAEQTISQAAEDGTTYTLTVAVGNRDVGSSADAFGFRLELLVGLDVVADTGDITNILNGDGTFTDVSLTYTAGAGDFGALGIRLVALADSVVDFDNIRLTSVVAVPEPASALLLGVGGLWMTARGRRKILKP